VAGHRESETKHRSGTGDMNTRLFAAGDEVRLADRSRVSRRTPETFRIMFEVHARGGAMIRYKIRNDEQEHERVELEINLVAED
jgi:hypothetical protein